MTNETQLRDLQRQLAQLTESIGRISGERIVPHFKEYAETYLAAKLANPTLRRATKKSFEHQVNNHLTPAFGNLPLEAITNAEFLKWVTWVRETNPTRNRKVTRFFNARKNLTEILHAAMNEGTLARVPKFDNPDAPRKVGRVLTDEEILSVLWSSYRPFRFIFYCMFRMGCRPREILQWEWTMFKWNEPGKTWLDIPARISKTDRDRSIAVNPAVSRILAIRYRKGNGSRFVFPSRDSLEQPQLSYHAPWRRACRVKGIKAAVPYDFRRTFITTRAASNKPAIFTAQHLDTSVQMMERVYVKKHVETMEDLVR